MRAREVLRECVRDEPRSRAIGERDRLLVAIERAESEEGPKTLFARKECVLGEVPDERGLKEVALIECALSARDERRATGERFAKVPLDLLARSFANQRPDVRCLVESAAESELAHLGFEELHGARVERAVDVNTLGSDAGLAGIAELRDEQGFDRGLEWLVFENQKRRVPAKLKRDPLQRIGRGPEERLANGRASREAELSDD